MTNLLTSASLCILVITATTIAQTPPRVTLPSLGVLEGKTMQTVGNLGVAKKEFYSFRNIKYADSSNRFEQSVAFRESLGTIRNPFDASVPGPLCPQGTMSPQSTATLANTDLKDLFLSIIDDLPVPVPGIVANQLVDDVIALLGALLNADLTGMTVGDLFQDVLDITLAVDEDCLHVSVSTPWDPTDGDLEPTLPVLVWVHGGGFTGGDSVKNDISRLGEVEDLIVVTVNYRLGPLGFLCLDTDRAGGNMGMLDIVRALEWVHEYIGCFGGDENRITIMGESAGSASIGHLVLSPATAGLFAQGIGQSGSAVSPWAFDTNPEYYTRLWSEKVGCNQDDHDLLVDCLIAADISEILNAFSEYQGEARGRAELGFDGAIPCGQTAGVEKFYTDGDTPESLLTEGNYDGKPIMFGANSHEGSYIYGVMYNEYLVPNNLTEDEDFLRNDAIEVFLGAVGVGQPFALVDLVEDYYFQDYMMGDLELMTPGLIDMLSTFFIKASSYQMIEQNWAKNASYWYSIEHTNEKKSMYNLFFWNDKSPYVKDHGVCHADELPYLFNINLPFVLCDLTLFVPALAQALIDCERDINCVLEPEGDFMPEWGQCLLGELTPEEQVWSDKLVKAWTNFIVHGDPSYETYGGDLPKIERWSKENPAYLRFNEDGVSIQLDYPQTYNAVMLSSVTTTTTATTIGVTATSAEVTATSAEVTTTSTDVTVSGAQTGRLPLSAAAVVAIAVMLRALK